MFETWIGAFLRPQKTFALEKNLATWKKGIFNCLAAGVISGIVAFVNWTFFLPVFFQRFGLLSQSYSGYSIGLLLLVASIVLAPIGLLVYAAVTRLAAKLVDGKGDTKGLFYLLSTFAVPISLLSIITWIPIAGSILYMLVGIYGLYLAVLAIREQQGLDTGNAVVAWLIGIVFLLVLYILLLLLIIFGVALFVLATRIPRV